MRMHGNRAECTLDTSCDCAVLTGHSRKVLKGSLFKATSILKPVLDYTATGDRRLGTAANLGAPEAMRP